MNPPPIPARPARAMVFAPSPWLETLLEETDAGPEVHLHAAGQGFWIARLLHTLGVAVTVCAPFGGETGAVVRALMAPWTTKVRDVRTAGSNGCSVSDGRRGAPAEIFRSPAAPLARHERDDLYGITLVEGMEADVVVLGGPDGLSSRFGSDFYLRLAGDLRASGRRVVADLSGPPARRRPPRRGVRGQDQRRGPPCRWAHA